MQGLMLKLANVDAAGERALRVVAYFDQLGANGPDLEAVVRATAVIADGVAGLVVHTRGIALRFSPDGESLAAAVASGPLTRSLDDGDGTVWLDRAGEPRELDEFILERSAFAVAAVLQRQNGSAVLGAASGLSDPALAQVLVSDRASEAERSRAARLMGLHPTSSIRLLAVEPDGDVELGALVGALRSASEQRVVAAELSRRLGLIVLVGADPPIPVVEGLPGRLGAGPVVETLDAPRSWSAARETLRFAGAGTPWPRILDAERLGVLRLLARLDQDVIAAEPDVAALAEIAAEPGGERSLVILDSFLHAGTLREAARATNFHHSSVQSRIDRLARRLGIELSTPAGRQRARLALLLYRSIR